MGGWLVVVVGLGVGWGWEEETRLGWEEETGLGWGRKKSAWVGQRAVRIYAPASLCAAAVDDTYVSVPLFWLCPTAACAQ